MTDQPLLQVKNLSVAFGKTGEKNHPVRDVSFSVAKGESVCLVGPSGCGKSMTTLALLGLLPPGGFISRGEILWDGVSVTRADPSVWRAVRKNCVSILFQEAAAALDPVRTIGWQIEEVLSLQGMHDKKTRRGQMLQLLQEVGFSSPQEQCRAYPHQLSGGMCQRAMTAIALAVRPKLLIADEPTTALDATIQAQILELLRREQRSRHMALLLITHDMGVVASMADRVVIMDQGCTVEEGEVHQIFHAPQHGKTRQLLTAAGVSVRGDSGGQ